MAYFLVYFHIIFGIVYYGFISVFAGHMAQMI